MSLLEFSLSLNGLVIEGRSFRLSPLLFLLVVVSGMAGNLIVWTSGGFNLVFGTRIAFTLEISWFGLISMFEENDSYDEALIALLIATSADFFRSKMVPAEFYL